MSVCLSAENLTCELNIFLELPYYSSYNAHILYADSFQQYLASEGDINYHQGQGRISKLHFSKNGCYGGISVSQTHLVQSLVIMVSFHGLYRSLVKCFFLFISILIIFHKNMSEYMYIYIFIYMKKHH